LFRVYNASCIIKSILPQVRAMKPKAQRIISPVWAQKIAVEIDGEALLVTGWGHLSAPIDGRKLDPSDAARLDIFKRFRRYSLRQLSAVHSGDSGGVYQFADATDDEKLIAFVKEFGPVWGKVVSSRAEDDDSSTLTVTQSLKKLRREQEVFAAAVKLLQELSRDAKADPAGILVAMAQILPPEMRLPEGFPTKASRNLTTPLPTGPEVMTYPIAVRFSALAIDLWCSTGFPKKEKKAAVISLARQVLCDLLNHHSPVLVPLESEVIEMPVAPNEGIMEALYFQLRLDFLAHRQIRACLNCEGYFPVHRRGARACGNRCQTALRNQKYWKTHKKTVNRNRRKKRAEGR
jgi:hypothetical protein